MKKINTLDELNITDKYKEFLKIFLVNVSKAKNVIKVILFGSLAKGNYNSRSDVDLFIITEGEPKEEEEVYIMADCAPSYDSEFYIESDILVCSKNTYEKYKYEMGMVQKYVEIEGIDLSGLLI